MKTLFVVNGAPYPPRSGSPLRTWQNVNVLAMRGPVAVFSLGEREAGDYAMPVVAEWTHVDARDFPAETGLRARATRALKQRHYPVPASRATATIDRQLRAVLERFEPDLVVLGNWKNAFPAPLAHRNVVLDMHNVESLLGQDLKSFGNPLLRALVLWRWRRRERDLVRRATAVWVCGENDVRELAKLDRRLPVPHVWPNALDVDSYAPEHLASIAPPFERNGATLIFVGSMHYRPNELAALELVEDVFPRIAARIPHARLLLVGATSERVRAAAAGDARIGVTGSVPDTRPYLACADLSVIPLRTGGGTRLKIIECFAAKVPVVSTPKGAEGIGALPEAQIRLAQSSDDLAAAALSLLDDPVARRAQAEAAHRFVNETSSWKSLALRLDDALPLESAERAHR